MPQAQALHYAGKRVLVTGSSSGIGRATAALLIDLDAEVHGVDVRGGDLGLSSFTHLDLRDPHAIEAAIAALGGRIDALFNCAGVAPGPSPLDVMKVNFIGARLLTDCALDLMKPGAAIVSVASNGGAAWAKHTPELLDLIGTESFDAAVAWASSRADVAARAYSYSKEALIVWTLARSAALIKRGVRINCTMPGAVQTPMLEQIEQVTPSAAIDVVAQPIGRRSTAEEQAWPLVFLNSEAASYLNGAVLPVDGGFAASRVLQTDAPAIGRK